MDKDKALVVFQDKRIRRIWHNNKWYFSVVDVVEALTESKDAKDYWYRLKVREAESSGIELSTFCRQLKLVSLDGKYYSTDCANTKSLFRIIQSIPSKKAEPFNQWLAQVGYERVEEIENPELGQDRKICNISGKFSQIKSKKERETTWYFERKKLELSNTLKTLLRKV